MGVGVAVVAPGLAAFSVSMSSKLRPARSEPAVTDSLAPAGGEPVLVDGALSNVDGVGTAVDKGRSAEDEPLASGGVEPPGDGGLTGFGDDPLGKEGKEAGLAVSAESATLGLTARAAGSVAAGVGGVSRSRAEGTVGIVPPGLPLDTGADPALGRSCPSPPDAVSSLSGR